jgi:hypothetical protein
MANRYKYNCKKLHGKLSKASGTFWASDIKDACLKFSELVNYKIVDKEYSYILGEANHQTSASSGGYCLFNFKNGEENVQAFIEKLETDRIKF